MKRWSAQKLVALCLAVFVTVGMGVSVIEASGMSAKMPMVAHMVMSGHDGCQGCLGSGDDGMKTMACRAVCATPVFAVLSESASVPTVQKPIFNAARDPLLRGRESPPDPYPPKPTDIG
ncbi:hypothetical protein [Hyphomicrobium sp.]|uniref:hypothetical protein n=1 Tax=Hyphomicrobium sp. TaxID=82 RepID=UPI000FB76F92|nr:hypothetical protein [Hyphomicrobium sp.]RUO99840.1 MAG: hypothetical protein EKK30_05145 [Hyphomicrobium sp.]